MRDQRRLVVIAKQRPFDEERWKQLLTAFAYVLHERRNERQAARATQRSTHAANRRDAMDTR